MQAAEAATTFVDRSRAGAHSYDGQVSSRIDGGAYGILRSTDVISNGVHGVIVLASGRLLKFGCARRMSIDLRLFCRQLATSIVKNCCIHGPWTPRRRVVLLKARNCLITFGLCLQIGSSIQWPAYIYYHPPPPFIALPQSQLADWKARSFKEVPFRGKILRDRERSFCLCGFWHHGERIGAVTSYASELVAMPCR